MFRVPELTRIFARRWPVPEPPLPLCVELWSEGRGVARMNLHLNQRMTVAAARIPCRRWGDGRRHPGLRLGRDPAWARLTDWPQTLKTCLRIMLASRQPMWVWWGPELINFYNDAYLPIIGGKHPGALGRPAREVWQEIWEQIRERIAAAMAGEVHLFGSRDAGHAAQRLSGRDLLHLLLLAGARGRRHGSAASSAPTPTIPTG